MNSMFYVHCYFHTNTLTIIWPLQTDFPEVPPTGPKDPSESSMRSA